MADIYSRLMDGVALAQQGADVKKRSTLASLYSQAIGAAPEQRQGYIGQIAALDPKAANDASTGLYKMDDSAKQALGQEAAIFAALPADQKPQAYAKLAQHAQSIGIPVPMEYNPGMDENIGKIAQALGGSGSDELKSLRIGANGNYWAIRGGQFVDTGTPAAPNVYVRDQPGVPFDMLDRRTGSSIYGQQPPQAPSGQVQSGNGQSVYIDPALPPNMRAAIAADESQFAQMPGGGEAPPMQGAPVVEAAPMATQGGQQPQATLPPALDYQNGGTVGSRPPARPASAPPTELQLRADARDEARLKLAQQQATQKPTAANSAETQKQAMYAKNMAQDALAFASAFTGLPLSQLQGMTPEQVRQAVLSHDRATAGPIVGSIWGMGKLANADLEAYSNSAAGKQARINNPTGPVTNADFEVARKSVFSSDKPKQVNADLVYQALLRAQQPTQAPAASGGKYQVGQIIEHGGKRYRVTGGDMNDPDVEEVR